MSGNDLSLEEIIRRWRSIGAVLKPVEGKPGYWHFYQPHPMDLAFSIDVEVTEDEIIAIQRARNTTGAMWDRINANYYRDHPEP